jgi:Cu(I)/Ag(I) efflux system membrane fusion protein
MKTKFKIAIILLLLAGAFFAGHRLGGKSPGGGAHEGALGNSHAGASGREPARDEAVPEVWTCSMHPQIRQPKKGLCPICAMELILVKSDGGGSGNPRELKLSPRAAKLAEIRTAPVERGFAVREVRMIGKIAFDETRLGKITARVPGRLDRLFANYRGVPVRKGEHLASLYSPELLTAQTELLQAIETAGKLAESGLESTRATALATVESARNKLRLWGLTVEQIEEVVDRGTPSEHMTIVAPMGGIVVEMNAVEGAYVDTGEPICTIADLTQVWIKLEAYESDLAWIRYGQDVLFEAEALPGKTFSGRIAFIDPVVDERKRTAAVRVNAANQNGRLMPGMFVRAGIESRMGAKGRILNADLAGKWISPMHPEIVKDGPGACDVCGMPLVPAESLGYAGADAGEGEAPLLIPATAPLITGTRAVVYVAVSGRDGAYEGREVVLGPRAGEMYVVREGLSEGEEVVVNGAFKIDSAVQILAGPSMMSSEGGGAALAGPVNGPSGDGDGTRFDVPAAFLAALAPAFDAYFDIHHALSRDDAEAGKQSAAALIEALTSTEGGALEGPVRAAWDVERKNLETSARALAEAVDLAAAREAFSPLSETLIIVARRFGAGGGGERRILLFHCPMAFDWRGANWLQNREGVENPYFGSSMFLCGEMKEDLSAMGEK